MVSTQTQTGPLLERSAFDFLPGSWDVKMRRRRVDGDLKVVSEWVEFDATQENRAILEGMGCIEEVRMEMPEGVKLSVGSRFYDPQTKLWTIYWANELDGKWQDNPMRGGFAVPDGMMFIVDDVWDGKPVLTRYYWRTLSHDHPTWEQSFSNDGGETWVSNWFMEFSRKP